MSTLVPSLLALLYLFRLEEVVTASTLAGVVLTIAGILFVVSG